MFTNEFFILRAILVKKGDSENRPYFRICPSKSQSYEIKILRIILFVTENGTPCYPVSRYDGVGTQKKAWDTKLETGE